MGILISKPVNPTYIQTLPNDIINKFLSDLLLEASHEKLLSLIYINKYCYSLFSDPKFMQSRYKANPYFKDSRTDLDTNTLITKLKTKYNPPTRMHTHKDNSIFIELNKKYSHIYQLFGFTKTYIEQQCLYNEDRIKSGMTIYNLTKLQIVYHGPNPKIQFSVEFNDDDEHCYLRMGNKILSDTDLYKLLYKIVYFFDIRIFEGSYASNEFFRFADF